MSKKTAVDYSSDESDETVCIICNNGYSTKKNQIVLCDGKGCDIPVHQKCYGINVIPPGKESWFCDRCADHVKTYKTKIVCCPKKKGAFRRTNRPEEYIHVECAYWNPNIDKYTKDKGYNIDECKAGEHVCSICNSKEGFTIRCSSKTPTQCENYIHVTCALSYDFSASLFWKQKLICKHHVDNKRNKRKKIQQTNDSNNSNNNEENSKSEKNEDTKGNNESSGELKKNNSLKSQDEIVNNNKRKRSIKEQTDKDSRRSTSINKDKTKDTNTNNSGKKIKLEEGEFSTEETPELKNFIGTIIKK